MARKLAPPATADEERAPSQRHRSPTVSCGVGAGLSPGRSLTSIRPGLARTGSRGAPRSPRAGERAMAGAAIARRPRHDPWPAAFGRSVNFDAAGADVAAGKRRDDRDAARARREPRQIDHREGIGEPKDGILQAGRLVPTSPALRDPFRPTCGRERRRANPRRPLRSRARTSGAWSKRIWGGRSPR